MIKNKHLELSRHCRLCENLDFNVSYGTKCGLTKDKPNFERKCHKIDFGKNAEKYITEVNIEKRLLEKEKFDYIGTFIMYLLISLFFMIGGILLTKYILGYGLFHTVTFILVGVGILALPKSFGTLNMYITKKRIVDEKLKNLEDTLNVYNKNYRIDLEINNIHGINEVYSKVKIN